MKKLVSLLLTAAMVLSMVPAMAFTTFAADSTAIPEEVLNAIQEVKPANLEEEWGKNGVDATYLVYAPFPAENLNGSTSPIVAVLGDKDYTKETAAQAVVTLGLKGFCTENNCYAVFVNSSGDSWSEADVAIYDGAINLFAEVINPFFQSDGLFPNALYLSAQDIIYVFAEGSGADFVANYLLKKDLNQLFVTAFNPDFKFLFSHVPSAVFLSNPKSTTGSSIDLGSIGVAGVVVNGNNALVNALTNATGATATDGNARYNPNESFKRIVSVSSSVTDGFDGAALQANIDTILNVRRDQSGDSFPLQQRLLWDRLGIDEYKLTYDTGDGNNVKYQVYIPQNLDTSKSGTVPLVLSFHGGGETADINMASTHYPILAKEEGFITIAVDQHTTEGSILDDTNIGVFLAKVFADYPCIDKTRVYASGMSMGALKTWTMGLNATEYFAAIAPFGTSRKNLGDLGGVQGFVEPPDWEKDGAIIPVFYEGGSVSTSIELPAPESERTTVNNHLQLILCRNQVTENYAFDETTDCAWGLEPNYTVSADYINGTYTVNKNYYRSSDGNVYTVLADIENLGHACYPFEAAEAWAFMKHFSRVDGKTVSTFKLPGSSSGNDNAGDIIEVKPANLDQDWGKNGVDTTYLVYAPFPADQLNGSTSPIVAVLGDQDYTKETAAQAVATLGLKDFCVENNCYAVFVNSKGDTWSADDIEIYNGAINLFAEVINPFFQSDGLFPNAVYLSAQDIIYVIAEGSGADFVANYLLDKDLNQLFVTAANPDFKFMFSHVPSAVFLSNPKTNASAIDLGSIGVAGVVVNGNDALVDAMSGAVGATVTDGDTRYNPDETFKRVVSVKSSVTTGFAGAAFKANQDMITNVRRDQLGEIFPLQAALNWDVLGIDEYKLNYTSNDGRSFAYQVYIPRNLDTTVSVPLMLLFHGGGETADIILASTRYPVIARDGGNFITVAVDQHFESLTETNVGEFIEMLFAKYPVIDQTRVYASGMSMGAVKSWNVGLGATEYFAAIAPFGAVRGGSEAEANGMLLPTYYVGGAASTMLELPQEPGDNAVTNIGMILTRNGVTDSYEYDPDINVWGIKPDYTTETSHADGYYTMHHNYFVSEDGNVYTVLNSVDNLGHFCYSFEAEQAWEFIQHFSRVDGKIVSTFELPTNPGTPDKTPATGDNNTLALWIACAAVSLCGICVLVTPDIRKRFSK